jgi:Zn-dependent protease with chaperone function
MAYREQARRNELEADRHAVEISARAGYDAAALSAYLRRIKADPERLAALEQRTPPVGELGGTEYLRLQQMVGVPQPPTLRRLRK